MKLCKDCRWAAYEVIRRRDENLTELERRFGADPPRLWECHHPSAHVEPKIDLVTGEPEADYEWIPCKAARSMTFNDWCGPDGRYWEQALEISGNIGFGEALAEPERNEE
jgi:hypothetical protein